MWACFVLIALAVASHGNYIDNPSAVGVHGTHKLVYTWPRVNENVSKCNEAIYSKPDVDIELTCKCDRESSNLALIQQEMFSLKYIILVDIIDKEEDLQPAMDDKCSCSPTNKSRDVIFKVNDDYFLQYEPGQDSRVYLFGNKVPTADEVAELIEGFSDLKDREGILMCQEVQEEVQGEVQGEVEEE